MGVCDDRYPPPVREITAERLAKRGPAAFAEFFQKLSDEERERLGNPLHGRCHWPFWARDEQIAPTGNWSTWLYLAGRGAGKSRSGGELTLDLVRSGKYPIIHLVAPTEADYRDEMAGTA